jgi:hypothetical protein
LLLDISHSSNEAEDPQEEEQNDDENKLELV